MRKELGREKGLIRKLIQPQPIHQLNNNDGQNCNEGYMFHVKTSIRLPRLQVM
jgi:hypothetical protein